MRRRIMIVLLIVVQVLLLLILKEPLKRGLCFLGCFQPTQSDLEEIYYNNESDLLTVCNFISEYDEKYEIIRIDVFDSTNIAELSKKNSFGGYDSEVTIITEKVTCALSRLKKEGFITILKENNYISFEVWGSFGGSVSLAFSPNVSPDITYINAEEKVLKKLKPKSWYYCKIIYE